MSFGIVVSVVENARAILDDELDAETLQQLSVEERKLAKTLSENLYENSIVLEELFEELRAARIQGNLDGTNDGTAAVESISLTRLLSEMKGNSKKTAKQSPSKSPSRVGSSKPAPSVSLPSPPATSEFASPTGSVSSPTGESLKPIAQTIVQKPALGVIASGAVGDVSGTLSNAIAAYNRLPIRSRLPGILEVGAEAVAEAIALSDSRLRYK